jgi:hypothetical protein
VRPGRQRSDHQLGLPPASNPASIGALRPPAGPARPTPVPAAPPVARSTTPPPTAPACARASPRRHRDLAATPPPRLSPGCLQAPAAGLAINCRPSRRALTSHRPMVRVTPPMVETKEDKPCPRRASAEPGIPDHFPTERPSPPRGFHIVIANGSHLPLASRKFKARQFAPAKLRGRHRAVEGAARCRSRQGGVHAGGSPSGGRSRARPAEVKWDQCLHFIAVRLDPPGNPLPFGHESPESPPPAASAASPDGFGE